MSTRGLTLLAEYNATFNRRLGDVLSAVPLPLTDTVLVQLNHIYVMDRVWLDRLRQSDPPAPFSAEMDTILLPDLGAWQPARTALDREIAEYVSGLVAPEEEIAFVTKSDHVAVCCRRDDALLHMFNHQSLHRGEILRILTDLGIAFGNSDLLPLIVRPLTPRTDSKATHSAGR